MHKTEQRLLEPPSGVGQSTRMHCITKPSITYAMEMFKVWTFGLREVSLLEL